jgi:DNA-binding XRE family transcriptional regulator
MVADYRSSLHCIATHRLQTTPGLEFYNHPLMDRRADFGERLRALREARGYSQEQFAEMARLHRTYIGGIERGERNVSLLNIWRIADALGVAPGTFFLAPEELDHGTSQRTSTSASGTGPKQMRRG